MVNPHKIFYKGEVCDFIIFIENLDLLEKFRNNDTTIPLIDIVSINKVFVNRQRGSEGQLDEASKVELKNEFGKLNDMEIIKKIIDEGEDKSSASIHKGHGGHNDSLNPGYMGN